MINSLGTHPKRGQPLSVAFGMRPVGSFGGMARCVLRCGNRRTKGIDVKTLGARRGHKVRPWEVGWSVLLQAVLRSVSCARD